MQTAGSFVFLILFAKHCFTFPCAATFNSKAWLSSNKSMAFLPFDPSNVLQFHMLPQSIRIARFCLESSNIRINSRGSPEICTFSQNTLSGSYSLFQHKRIGRYIS
ncbi:hypothetical protein ACOSQ3_014765 [Xanthoceras sorbifolium]